jgi:DNA-binding MarR family transcriptional regulator
MPVPSADRGKDDGKAGVSRAPVRPPDADPVGISLADAVSRLRRAMRRAARAQGPGGSLPGGLSVAQLEFLSCLAENPASRPGQLARLLRLAPSSVATLVNGMAKAGLVVRTGGVDDKRTATLDLTAAGYSVVAEWQEVNSRILALALDALPAPARSSLDSSLPALRQLTSAIDAIADAPTPVAAGEGTVAATG